MALTPLDPPPQQDSPATWSPSFWLRWRKWFNDVRVRLNNAVTSLTTTGTGAATLASGVLNIPVGGLPPSAWIRANNVGAVTLSSTTYVTLAGLSQSLSGLTAGQEVELAFQGVAFNSSAPAAYLGFEFFLNGVASGWPTEISPLGQAANTPEFTIGHKIRRVLLAGDLVAGVLTVDLKYKVDSGSTTAVLLNSGGYNAILTITRTA